MKHFFYTIVVYSFFHLFFSSNIFASTYGENNYGNNQYGVSTTQTQSNSTSSEANTSQPAAPESCQSVTPGDKSPKIYAALPLTSTSLRLYFTEPDQPTDKLVIQFGTQSGNYPFGSDNISYSPGLRTFDVEHLQAKTTYHFQMRAGNGCAVGRWSSEFSASTSTPKKSINVGGSQKPITLEVTDVRTEEEKTTFEQTEASKSTETQYEKIFTNDIKKNQEETLDFEVEVFVQNEQGQPIANADVTLYSEPKYAKSDEYGIARFSNVEPGQHRVEIAYNNFFGEKEFTLNGDVKKFQIEITAAPQNPFIRSEVLIVLGILIIVILLLLFRNWSHSRFTKS